MAACTDKQTGHLYQIIGLKPENPLQSHGQSHSDIQKAQSFTCSFAYAFVPHEYS
jgi:hypothetical protein